MILESRLIKIGNCNLGCDINVFDVSVAAVKDASDGTIAVLHNIKDCDAIVTCLHNTMI